MKTYQGQAEAEARTKRNLGRAMWVLMIVSVICLCGLIWAVWGQVEALNELLKLMGEV